MPLVSESIRVPRSEGSRSFSLAATPRWKIWLWAIAGALTVKVLVYTEIIAGLLDPEYRKHFDEIKWLLVPHAISGSLALLAGPFLFSKQFRSTNLEWHRRLGRVYVYCTFVAAPLGVAMAARGWHPDTFAVSTFAGAWVLSTALAFVFAVRRNIAVHQEWMVRSYCIAFIFVLDRVPLPCEMEPAIHACTVIIWVLLAFVVPQMVFNWRGQSQRGQAAT